MTGDLTEYVRSRILARNPVSSAFFAREAERLARACREMSDRFLRGGRLLAFGKGPSASDAQHVSVEFVHPVIVGKRALPALDLSPGFQAWLPALVRPDDMVMGFAGPGGGDADVEVALREAGAVGAQTFALPGPEGSYAVDAPADDVFISQEILEILYHTLWETVHVFFEHREMGHDVGPSGFLYPFLGTEKQDTTGVVDRVAQSIQQKAAQVEALRASLAEHQAHKIAEAAGALHGRLGAGGVLILFGNGGSATDANDWALDAASPPAGWRVTPAISLAMEAANVSAIANDVGAEAVFLRQLIAQARPGDVVVALSTSGGSANILSALEEARARGMMTMALLGYDGGEVLRRGLADHALVVDCDYIPRIQEVHATVYHVLMDALERLNRGH